MLLCLLSVPIILRAAEPTGSYEHNWPQWRGPRATGVAPHGDPPVRWNEQVNVRWKTAIPGQGHATPIIWDDRVFILTAVKVDKSVSDRRGLLGRILGTLSAETALQFNILALNRADGSLLWQRTVITAAPHEGRHEDGSWASLSPVTDGEYVIASFGSRGIYCYDMDGALQWQKDLGDMSIRYGFGEGSSPAMYADRVVVTWDHEGASFIVALDRHTGRELWRVNRDDGTSWATPLIVEHAGEVQVVTSGMDRVRSYALDTGTLLWETRGMTSNPIPSPVAEAGVVYVTGGYRESILQAISLAQARGDVKQSGALLWEYRKDTPYVSSPLLYDGALYFLKGNQGILSCFNARTGASYYTRQRLTGISGVYASPVAANGRVYLAGRNGTTLVLQHGPAFTVLATNILDDNFDASPAIVGNEIYLRGHRFLYCIAGE